LPKYYTAQFVASALIADEIFALLLYTFLLNTYNRPNPRMKEALKQVSLLVERFERNIEAYRSPAYNETQLRVEFIDPFHRQLAAVRTLDEKIRIQRQIDPTDHQIDQMVYELYGLTDKEIYIIKEGGA
jgi:hypothetical protein